MFGNKSHVSPLELRKQLLIAESELNRDQMAKEMAALTAGVRELADRAKSFGSIASSAAVLIAGLTAFKRRKSAAPEAKLSWLQTILKGVSVISGLWLAFRSGSGRTDA